MGVRAALLSAGLALAGAGRFVVDPGPFTVLVGSSSLDRDLVAVRLDVR